MTSSHNLNAWTTERLLLCDQIEGAYGLTLVGSRMLTCVLASADI